MIDFKLLYYYLSVQEFTIRDKYLLRNWFFLFSQTRPYFMSRKEISFTIPISLHSDKISNKNKVTKLNQLSIYPIPKYLAIEIFPKRIDASIKAQGNQSRSFNKLFPRKKRDFDLRKRKWRPFRLKLQLIVLGPLWWEPEARRLLDDETIYFVSDCENRNTFWLHFNPFDLFVSFSRPFTSSEVWWFEKSKVYPLLT